MDDPQIAMPVVDEIATAGKMIASGCGADACERTHPARIAEIAKRFPQVKIICVHADEVSMPDMSKAAIELAQAHNAYVTHLDFLLRLWPRYAT